MEYLEGQTLSAIIARALEAERCMPLDLHLRAIAGALEGLHYAHELKDFDGTALNLVHRDVSPHNVFVTYEGHVKVLDFGIAKAVGRSAETRPGVLKGKIAYMAPEQMAAEKIDRRADIFSTGVMLWEATAGRHLWKGQDDRAVMLRVLDGKVPKIAEAAPWASARLQRIIERAVAPAPADRYATAAEMLHELEEEIAELGGASQRELAAYVSEEFRELRAETKAALEQQLGKLSLSDTSDSHRSIEVTLEILRRRRRGDAETMMSTIADPEGATRAGVRARRRLAVLVALGLCAAAATAVIVRRARTHGDEVPVAASPSSAPAAPAVPAAPPPPPEPAAVTSVQIDIAVNPASAQVTWDDRPIDNPSTQRLPRDDSRHLVRASAKGYVTRLIEVALDRDARLEVSLERAAPTEPAPKPKATPASPASPGASPPRAMQPPPSCDPPYYVDERGIRKIKPECM